MNSLQDFDLTGLIMVSLSKWGKKFGEVLYVKGGWVVRLNMATRRGGLVFC